ncbi:hypothetical protein FAGKG844_160112 [Frankia sp. AgKG'84/4]
MTSPLVPGITTVAAGKTALRIE